MPVCRNTKMTGTKESIAFFAHNVSVNCASLRLAEGFRRVSDCPMRSLNYLS